jgi:hypothetical protein
MYMARLHKDPNTMDELKIEFALTNILDYKTDLSCSKNAERQNSQINGKIQANLNISTKITIANDIRQLR